ARPGPNSRPRQRTPVNWLKRSGNQGEPSEPAFTPGVHGQPHDTATEGLPPAAASRAPGYCGIGGPPPATTSKSRPRAADRPR
ncbi:hypothetical protein, partial [Pseudarthrobacter oxydans]|uniref:hypothetical protein n=1 Tax=Pseudarthrobacter oxydans TaxID=1671 RepID=UPI003822F420